MLQGPEIAALVIGLTLTIIVSTTFLSLTLLNKSDTFTKNPIFHLKKYLLICSILLINVGGCVLVYYTRSLQVLLWVILVLKSKDILMAVMFVFNMLYKGIISLSGTPELLGTTENIVAFVPVYKESLDQVTRTVDSIMNNKLSTNYLLTTIVSDGANNYSDIFTSIVRTCNGTYESWKGDIVNVKITYGQRNNKPLVLIAKEHNVGKKDSVIVFNDIFNYVRYNAHLSNKSLREDILFDLNETFGVNHFNYIYATDGDTIVSDTNLMYLLDTMKRKNAFACCGVVNVDQNYGNWFWNWMQNYQYLYGQYMRRTNEDIFNQVLCLPGCNSMFKIHSETANAMELFSQRVDENNLIVSSIQNVGTDRRLTGSLIYTSSQAKIVMDLRAHAYTVPPDSWLSYIDQRKRWTQNMYFNNFVNIIAPNINLFLRFFNFVDWLRLSLIYFRLFNTVYFIYLLSAFYDKQVLELLPYIVILLFPVICFFVYALFDHHLRKQYWKLILTLIVNKIFTFLTTFIIFTVMLYNIGYYSWVTRTNRRNSIYSIEMNNIETNDNNSENSETTEFDNTQDTNQQSFEEITV